MGGGGSGTRFVDKLLFVNAFPAAIPSSSNTARVSLKRYNRIDMYFTWVNTTTVTGSAITLLQAQDVSGTNEKALNFLDSWQTTVTDVTDPRLTYQAVVGNTLTLPTTNSLRGITIIGIDANKLDLRNGFTAIRAAMATAVAQTVGCVYLLGNVPRFGGESLSFGNPMVN